MFTNNVSVFYHQLTFLTAGTLLPLYCHYFATTLYIAIALSATEGHPRAPAAPPPPAPPPAPEGVVAPAAGARGG
jgi:hypothetical protein